MGGLGGASSLGTLEDMLRKFLDAGAPLSLGKPDMWGGSYTKNFDS
jgi:hypothetical protein